MNNYAYETAYYDLCGIAYLLRLKNNEKFNQVPVYSLSRDACLIIYQINKDLLNEKPLDNSIKVIRHKTKLYNKKGKNEKIYNDILNNSIAQFGDDVDNLGFYLEDGLLVGSTIFVQYVFLDTNLLNSDPKKNQQNALKFFTYVGSIAREFAETIHDLSIYELPPFITNTFFEYTDSQEYQMKDSHYFQLFDGNDQNNVVKTRFLLIIQEVTFCLWLQKGIKFDSDENFLGKYMAVRLISIKADEVMDNLKNIQKYLQDEFEIIDKKFNGELSTIIKIYDSELKKECQTLRNFLHYNCEGENFLDYIILKRKEDSQYEEKIINRINQNAMEPLYKVLSEYFDINQLKSMSEWEKIRKRSVTIIKKLKIK